VLVQGQLADRQNNSHGQAATMKQQNFPCQLPLPVLNLLQFEQKLT